NRPFLSSLAEGIEKAPVPSMILNHGASITLSTLTPSLRLNLRGRSDGTDRGFSANFDRQASATNSVSFLWSLPNESEQNPLLLCFVPPRSDPIRNLVPRFDRASNRTPDSPPSSLAVEREPPQGVLPLGSLRGQAVARIGVSDVCRTDARCYSD